MKLTPASKDTDLPLLLAVGPNCAFPHFMVEAIQRTKELADVDPWWMEEPTSPDDILGHARIRREVSPIRIATGEHCHNRVMFKQFMQANAIDICQIDSCRLAGVSENLAVLLLAAKFNIPVCPHGGGVGLCECVQHLAIFDYLSVSGSLENRVTEFVDHLHEHFVDPVRVINGHYLLPLNPGYSTEIRSETLSMYSYPDGPVWKRLGVPFDRTSLEGRQEFKKPTSDKYASCEDFDSPRNHTRSSALGTFPVHSIRLRASQMRDSPGWIAWSLVPGPGSVDSREFGKQSEQKL